jgi:hypothetical protein
MALDPWSYAARSEHSQQVALFMWANMAANFGPVIADDPLSYNKAGFAKTQFEGSQRKGTAALGFKRYAAPVEHFKLLHAIKNQGHGDKIRGNQSKAEGVKAGVLDTYLPVPRVFDIPYGFGNAPFVGAHGVFNERGQLFTGYHGIYVEMKKLKGGVTSAAQEAFQTEVRLRGYAAEICEGWEAARDVLLTYMGLNNGKP